MQQTNDPLQLFLNQLTTQEKSISYKIYRIKNKIGSAMQAKILEGSMNINYAQEIAAYLVDNLKESLNEAQFNTYISSMKIKFPIVEELIEEK